MDFSVSDYSTKVSYNEEEARVFLANRVRYHDDTYILTYKKIKMICFRGEDMIF